VYLSCGDDVATAFVLRLVQPLLDDPERFSEAMDPKTSLQEVAARRGAGLPVYSIASAGPDHARTFTATVTVGDLITATGEGTSKKQAEMAAALHAWKALVRKRRHSDASS
jgi:ribonuclease-3